MKHTSLIIFVFLSQTAVAGDIYKCKVDGKLIFQDQPCPELSSKAEIIKVEVVGGSADPIIPHQERINRAAQLGKVMVGMTTEQVRRSWGRPTSVHKSFVAGIASEQWVYRWSPGSSQYVYFDSGKVTAWN